MVGEEIGQEYGAAFNIPLESEYSAIEPSLKTTVYISGRA
jgi:hypothetical protein